MFHIYQYSFQYMDDCKFDVPTYLIIAGGILIAFACLCLLDVWTPCGCEGMWERLTMLKWYKIIIDNVEF